jgi:outer membrane protein assembly factor BamA
LVVDTFNRPTKPSAGVQLQFGGDFSQALNNSSNYFRFGADVAVPINLWQGTHILFLRAQSQMVVPLHGTVPFTELATLGGVWDMRGFRAGRFRDFSSLYMSAEYRWAIWMWADAFLFGDYGGVFGQSYTNLSADKLLPDVGGGLRLRTSTHLYLSGQVAYGFPDGIQFYLTFGTGPSINPIGGIAGTGTAVRP